MTPYRQVEARFRRIGALEEALRVLDWDTAVMMPPGGARARAEQVAGLRVVIHRELCARDLAELLAAAEEAQDPWQRANLLEMRRRHAHAAALSDALVEALSRARSECEPVWRRARADDDFAAVRGPLEKLLALTREAADCEAEHLGVSPYEALLGHYEPGGRTDCIDRLFEDLGRLLPDLIEAALSRQAAMPASALPGSFPIAAQRQAITQLMTSLGFDFSSGRLDVSLHPFCGGVSEDVRVTARYDENDFSVALMAALHETGHALYERGLPADWRLQPVGAARGMAVHESQSLLIEMQLCRSRAFCVFAAPILATAFAGPGAVWEPEALYRRQTTVRRGLIRVEADEVTYPAHVILRYRLERAMIEGDLAVADLPAAWTEGMRALLGIEPPGDREGCLQDIHWYDGCWGYFPTYTLGALIAAQLFAAARRALPLLERQISQGDFRPLLAWLSEHIHAKGSLLSTAQLVEAATGEALGTAAFETHLRSRYIA